MNSVKVNKQDLLGVLRLNRQQHHLIFVEAQSGYRSAVIKELDAMLQDALDGKKIRRTLTLVEPVDQTKDYDRVIAMLEMSVDDEIELAEHEFQMYVLDEWGWKHQFLTNNSLYSATLQGGKQ